MLQHCNGKTSVPADRILKFVGDTLVAEVPLDEAEMSLVEMRTLGDPLSPWQSFPLVIVITNFC